MLGIPEILLHGCAPVPLAHYLKALGILRLVAEQVDPKAKGSWKHDVFAVETRMTAEMLVDFFLHEYRPSPVLAPWNGGSGFFPKDNSSAVGAIERSENPRLASYRDSIVAARKELQCLGLTGKPDGEAKLLLIQGCRNSFPEDALGWLDAVLVLTQNGVKFPPLLGTGGNDGRLEFTNNFMQRLTEVLDPVSGKPRSESEGWLRASLFGNVAPRLSVKGPVGQFYPGAAGGVNATSGFVAPAAVNPWEFILMIEGALLFAAASCKRLESGDDSSLVYPFCVRQVGVGYASAAVTDEAGARCEMWMPLWSKPTGLSELRAILSEGRAQVRGRAARTGVDFAEAAMTLGVERGITAFQRYGFQVRNGLAYFATPLERLVVRHNARVDLLADFEEWYDRLRQKAGTRANPAPPASVVRALNKLERGILDLCCNDTAGRLQAILAALGMVERALARSFKWTKDAYIRPLQGLRAEWLTRADDGSVEFRLAQSVAASRAHLGKETLWLRQHLEPVEVIMSKEQSWVNWSGHPGNDVVWHDGDLNDALNAILARRLVRVEKSGAPGWPDWSPCSASLGDITAFIERRTNDDLLADLIWGLSLVDGALIPKARDSGDTDEAVPSSFYALLRLCFQRVNKGQEQKAIPLVPAILNRAMAGDGKTASELAARRLRASGRVPLVPRLPVAGDGIRRTAAAMLFPISPRGFRLLEQSILQQNNHA